MKCSNFIFLCLVMLSLSCASSNTSFDFRVQRIVIDQTDKDFGYYNIVEPKNKRPKGVLILLPGFGQTAESIFTDTKIPKIAFEQELLTLSFSGKTRLSADSIFQEKFDKVLEHAINHFNLPANNVIIGGFSNGGRIALRYSQLCLEQPDNYPIAPKGIFLVDAPIDMFHSWKLSEQILADQTNPIAVNEANWIKKFYHEYYGATPTEDPQKIQKLNPFSMDKAMPRKENILKSTPIRAYHDIDIAWRILERKQTPEFDNFIATAELINRLRSLGNTKAEFIQTYKTGFRNNGKRHPHSWSIVDADKLVLWALGIINNEE